MEAMPANRDKWCESEKGWHGGGVSSCCGVCVRAYCVVCVRSSECACAGGINDSILYVYGTADPLPAPRWLRGISMPWR